MSFLARVVIEVSFSSDAILPSSFRFFFLLKPQIHIPIHLLCSDGFEIALHAIDIAFFFLTCADHTIGRRRRRFATIAIFFFVRLLQ